jgi:hypothetical protein
MKSLIIKVTSKPNPGEFNFDVQSDFTPEQIIIMLDDIKKNILRDINKSEDGLLQGKEIK